jgi:hypothetical protein
MRILFVIAAVTLFASPLAAQTRIDPDSSKKAPQIMPAFVTVGDRDPNHVIPTVDGVPGAGIDNLDIAFPDTILQHGTVYVVQVAAQDASYTGSCDVTYQLSQVQGGINVILDSGTINPAYACKRGQNFAVGNLTDAIPDAPGLATLTGTIAYGTKKVSTKVSVLIK